MQQGIEIIGPIQLKSGNTYERARGWINSEWHRVRNWGQNLRVSFI